MKINTVEDAYVLLAAYVKAFAGSRQWDTVGCSMQLLGSMARGSQWLLYQGKRNEKGGFEDDRDAVWSGLDAAIYLRDDFLRTTGDRIWGLTFTLFPTGKFKIEYDYNKPEGYEETDETIRLGDALGSLQAIVKSDKPK
jgi:hypothetical protein